MTDTRQQIDPHNPGPTISVLAVMHTLLGIGEITAHVIEKHEIDDGGKGDLAVLTLRISALLDQFEIMISQDPEIVAAETSLVEEAAASVPDDIWTALTEVVGEDEVAKIQASFKDSGE